MGEKTKKKPEEYINETRAEGCSISYLYGILQPMVGTVYSERRDIESISVNEV